MTQGDVYDNIGKFIGFMSFLITFQCKINQVKHNIKGCGFTREKQCDSEIEQQGKEFKITLFLTKVWIKKFKFFYISSANAHEWFTLLVQQNCSFQVRWYMLIDENIIRHFK